MLATGSLRRVIAAGAVAVTLVGLGGASAALHGDHNAAGPRHIARRSVDNSHYCDGCSPPLVYNGGPVADTSGAAGFTVIPIFWAPRGYTYPPNYVKAVSGYLKNVAAASRQTGNVFSIASEYFQKTNWARSTSDTGSPRPRRSSTRTPIRRAAASSRATSTPRASPTRSSRPSWPRGSRQTGCRPGSPSSTRSSSHPGSRRMMATVQLPPTSTAATTARSGRARTSCSSATSRWRRRAVTPARLPTAAP